MLSMRPPNLLTTAGLGLEQASSPPSSCRGPRESGQGCRPVHRIVLVLACILLSACQPPAVCREAPGCVWIPPDEPLVLGVLRTWVGEQAAAGAATLAGVQQAIEERGSLLGHRLVLSRAASECTPESARIAVTALLTNARLFLILGPTCSTEIPVIAPLVEEAGAFLITPPAGEEAAYQQTSQILAILEQIAIPGRDGALYLPRRELQRWLASLP